MKLIAMASVAILLAGCATTRPTPVSTDGFCALGLFYPDEGALERWTPAERERLVIQNQTTERLCGLEPAP
jgi:hypothetical protein